MKARFNIRTVAALAVTLVAAFSLSTATSPAAHHKADGPVYWLDLSGTSSIAPHRVFFTANAGGYLKKINWKNWGSKKTVGRGIFGSTGTCGPNFCSRTGPGRLVLRKPVKCHPAFGNKQGKTIRVYRHGTLYYPDLNNKGKRLVTNVSDRTGWGACKESYRSRATVRPGWPPTNFPPDGLEGLTVLPPRPPGSRVEQWSFATSACPRCVQVKSSV